MKLAGSTHTANRALSISHALPKGVRSDVARLICYKRAEAAKRNENLRRDIFDFVGGHTDLGSIELVLHTADAPQQVSGNNSV